MGKEAGFSNTTGQANAFFGYQAGYSTTGDGNTFVGAAGAGPYGSGYLVTTGSRNTILGAYNGNQGGLDIRTSSNYIVLSDGDGNPRAYWNSANASFNGALNLSGSGDLTLGTGNLLLYGNSNPAVGVAMVSNSTAPKIIMSHATGTASGAPYMEFNYNSSGCGNITQNGSSAVLFTSLSDHRAKINQMPLSGSGDFIDALQPKKWDWVNGDGSGVGFIAHEFQEVCPNSVTGEKDAVDENGKPKYQSMQASSPEVIANLVAEIQSLRKRLAALEAK
jgi:hypothetical protein